MIRMIRRARSKQREPIPGPTSLSFQIPDELRDFLLHNTGEEDPARILAFGDREVLESVTYDEWFGDGTFDKVPAVFQLYTIHCKIGYTFPPFLYFLLPNKTRDTFGHKCPFHVHLCRS